MFARQWKAFRLLQSKIQIALVWHRGGETGLELPAVASDACSLVDAHGEPSLRSVLGLRFARLDLCRG